jgi:hypothetical protein
MTDVKYLQKGGNYDTLSHSNPFLRVATTALLIFLNYECPRAISTPSADGSSGAQSFRIVKERLGQWRLDKPGRDRIYSNIIVGLFYR